MGGLGLVMLMNFIHKSIMSFTSTLAINNKEKWHSITIPQDAMIQ